MGLGRILYPVIVIGFLGNFAYRWSTLDDRISEDCKAYEEALSLAKGSDDWLSQEEADSFFGRELGLDKIPTIESNKFDYLIESRRFNWFGLYESNKMKLFANDSFIGTTTREQVDAYIDSRSRE